MPRMIRIAPGGVYVKAGIENREGVFWKATKDESEGRACTERIG
jgi:hypothetical protein